MFDDDEDETRFTEHRFILQHELYVMDYDVYEWEPGK